jgi:uncharacterized protein YndB with AHSA1/START domain
MSKVTATIDIAASPQEVWEKLMDPSHLDDWVTIHRKLRDYSDSPLKDGSTMEQTLCLRGVNFNVKWEVVEYDPPHTAVMEGRGPMRSKARISEQLTETDDGGTRLEYSNEFHAPGGPMGAAASRVLVGGVPQKEANASLKQLKSLLER